MALFTKGSKLVYTFIRARRSDKMRKQKLQDLEDFLHEIEKLLESHPRVPNRPTWLNGEHFCINDIVVASLLWKLLRW